ncbi:phosphatidylglycerophosphatase A [Methanococcus aeolicus Nankai-3]|uniref:Phosphatidylglycerophosphatase A n=1 Tax=Methanococcus aeolicus (strain ATCC BAA-1280 / DSM 17508 / OCM 812 / Nankai-3) TaxID=419665 RepID=A6UX43_META3|nr:phosphatidylglycerophosphatase A [Methanococcus aeolicus]ABR57065.1 phosphatidylglycerophosphatase A [Methanococcus aeolicus Nankai-3]
MSVDVIKLLSNYNISIDSIINCGMELCICNEDEIEIIRKKLERELLKNLSNPNLSTLIIASIKLEEEGKKGNLPFNYDEDPNYIYADEVIGMAIANEIAGTKATFNFKWYDRKKPGIIGTLDENGLVFLDDAIAGLIAGCMSKIFEC